MEAFKSYHVNQMRQKKLNVLRKTKKGMATQNKAK